MKKLNLDRTIILAASLLLQLGEFTFRSHGAAGDVDLSFDPGSGVNGTVHVVAAQPDGKVIVVGEFSMVKGLQRFRIARLNADGSGDPTFIPPTAGSFAGNGNVYAIVLQSDGKVLFGTSGFLPAIVNGFSVCQPVARLNADGSLDNNFSVGTAFYCSGPAYSVATQSNGKVFIGGLIATTNEFHGLARLNVGGSLDSSFGPGLDFHSSVYSLAVQSDGKVLFGEGGAPITRLNTNGSLDASFNPGTGANDILSIALQPDGNVLIGGEFTSVNGTNRNRLAVSMQMGVWMEASIQASGSPTIPGSAASSGLLRFNPMAS